MDLDFIRIECEIVTPVSTHLTSTLHAALWHFEGQFRAHCCHQRQDHSCSACAAHGACPYFGVFAQQLSSDPDVIRKHQKPSLPFTLYVGEVHEDSPSYTVGMVVIGSAVNFADYFHAVLIRVVESSVTGDRSSESALVRSFSLDCQGIRHEINQAAPLSDSVILLSGQHILDTVHSDNVKLTLKSPLRLVNNGHIAHHFDFGMFFRSQMRRCSSLCAYYGNGKLELDFAELSRLAQNVAVLGDEIHYTQPVWSSRPNRAGLTGSAYCSGLVEPMSALLLLGSYFNAGKGAAFGSGYYQVEQS